MDAQTTHEKIEGIEWCVEHSGIVDEAATYNSTCDQVRHDEAHTPCRVVPVYWDTAGLPDLREAGGAA